MCIVLDAPIDYPGFSGDVLSYRDVLRLVNRMAGYGAGPRAADLLGVACFALAALLLRPVDERRREDVPVGPEASAPVGAAEAVATG